MNSDLTTQDPLVAPLDFTLTQMNKRQTVSERSMFAYDDKNTLQHLFSSFLLSSRYYVPVDVVQLNCYWRIEDNGEAPENQTLYLFELDGTAYIQNDVLHRRIPIKQEYFDAATALLPAGDVTTNKVAVLAAAYTATRLTYGKESSSAAIVEKEGQRSLDAIWTEHQLQATHLPAQDIGEIEQCWRVHYTFDGQTQSTDLYLFALDGEGYAQEGLSGPRTVVRGELYWYIVGLFPL